MMACTSVLNDGDGVDVKEERINSRGDGLAPGFSGMLSRRMMGGAVVYTEENRWLVRGRMIGVEGTVEEGLRV
ncbi:hypothetical protein D8674_026138 [Pyrus ussuriensis x Pyrus communis]|uniref:Uncharacterized protein n=1 Tax=Pyrus ussuriensis x Pyrus communis TaxID=2448454 RepID=A0A5N5IKG6_9ROSA|nr:hypothetical protein D8674_026138 [Pyrus ussuriensis x Pyrus communis]